VNAAVRRTKETAMRILQIITAVLVLTIACGDAFAQSWLPDPMEILARADSAMRSVESISYQAEHFTIGTIKYGDKTALIPPSRGEVKLESLKADSAFGAKVAVDGIIVRSQPHATNSPFKVAYDGRRVRKLDSQKQTVYANEPDQTGQMLFVEAQDLILWAFTSDDRLERHFSADTVSYAGAAVVGGMPCYIVYEQRVGETLTTETWWFFGVDDYLPRKVQRRYLGIPDQERMEITTLTDLNVNPELEAATFVLKAPEGYEVKQYQGFGTPSPALSVGDKAPAWRLQDAQGKEYSLAGLQGKVVVMDFWATWCGPCIQAMPKLQDLHERFADRGVVVLGISTWEGGDPAAFMREKGYTYQLLVDGDEVAKAYNVNGLPTLYVIGPEGKVIYGEVGTAAYGYEKLVQVIEDHLAGK